MKEAYIVDFVIRMLTTAQYAAQLYPETQPAEGDSSEASDVDIEDEIKKEVEEIRRPSTEPLFRNIKLSGSCCKPHGVTLMLSTC